MRLRYAAALLLAIPLADALFLVYVAGVLGWQLTVALVVLTAILGMLLVRAEGRHTLARISRKLERGEAPTDELLDGGLLIAAGAFLLTPGLVTDAIGFLLALPVSRYPIRAALKRFVVVPALDRKTDGFVTGNVYVGGFPGGDGDGGFGGANGGPFGGSSGPSGPDSSGGSGSSGGPGGTTGDSGTAAGSEDDVVDVDYSVEDSDQ